MDFNLLDAFHMFDSKGKGTVTKFEIKEILNRMDIFPNSDELYLFFKRIDKDNDGLLKYSEFCSAIIP